MCTSSLKLEQVSGTYLIREEPILASKHSGKYAYNTKKSKHSSSASKRRIVCRSTNIPPQPRTKRPDYFRFARVSTFCLKAITVVIHEYRHEFGAACISPPTSRPSSSPRRGRSASASSPATDSFNPNPDQWEGKVSTLPQIFVVYLRIVQSKQKK